VSAPEAALIQPIHNTVLDTADRRKRKLSAEVEQQDVVVPAQKRAGIGSGLTPTAHATIVDLYGEVDKDEPVKQRSETVEAYISRLPPSRSAFDIHGPWLWVHDATRQSSSVKTFDKEEFMDKAYKLLSDFRDLENKTRESMPGKAAGTITRKLTPKRKELEQDLRKVAKETACLSGKWMLFPQVDDVDRVWRAVCEGVDSGKLGPTAKVATNGGEVRNERETHLRLICIYTKDFSDEKDVRRVLDALLEMNLVKLPEDDMGNGIYYKCDAYTYLNLGASNDYKIKASIYSSKEMLKGIKWNS